MVALIGITTNGKDEKDFDTTFYKNFYTISPYYIEAIRRAGGIPVLLPPGEEQWEELLSHLDGVIISGGADINPEEYGGDSEHPYLGRLDLARDASEFRIARRMVESQDKPVLCICRGMQVLNVVLGGTMQEHLPDVLENDIHRSEKGSWQPHPVHVEADSLLAEVMGTTEVTTYSGHHQAIKDLAPSLRVVAHAPDGIIEAVQHENHPWLIAVQWHPEKSAAEDASQQAIFDEFVKVAERGLTEKAMR